MPDTMKRHKPHVGRLARPQTMGPSVLQYLDQTANEPQDRMDAEKSEGRIQQRQQGDVDGVDDGVLLAIRRIDMWIEADEIGSRLDVALTASMHPVLRRQRGIGVVRRQDVMRSMAIGALGGRAV